MRRLAKILLLATVAIGFLSACSTKRPFPQFPQVSMRKIEAEGSSWYCYTHADAMASADWHDQIDRFRRAYEK